MTEDSLVYLDLTVKRVLSEKLDHLVNLALRVYKVLLDHVVLLVLLEQRVIEVMLVSRDQRAKQAKKVFAV